MSVKLLEYNSQTQIAIISFEGIDASTILTFLIKVEQLISQSPIPKTNPHFTTNQMQTPTGKLDPINAESELSENLEEVLRKSIQALREEDETEQ